MKIPLCPIALLAHNWVFALCNRFDYVQVQGWWCNLVLFPAGSQTSEQADRKSRGNSDKPCENGVRTHSRCSQSHFPSGLFKACNEGCSLRLHIITVKLSSQNTSLALTWAMISEFTFCALRVFLCSVHVSSLKALFWWGGLVRKNRKCFKKLMALSSVAYFWANYCFYTFNRL